MPLSHRGLPHRIRTLVTISALYTCRRRKLAFEIVERSLRRRVFPRRFFSELFIHLSLFIGYPAMLDGLERLATLKAKGRTPSTSPARWRALSTRGMALVRRVYGKQTEKLLLRLEELEEGLSTRITEDAYGTVMARPGLSLVDREVINIVVLFIEGYEPQLYSHIRGGIRLGAKPRTIQSVLTLAGRIASKNPRRALHLVKEIASNMKSTSF